MYEEEATVYFCEKDGKFLTSYFSHTYVIMIFCTIFHIPLRNCWNQADFLLKINNFLYGLT